MSFQDCHSVPPTSEVPASQVDTQEVCRVVSQGHRGQYYSEVELQSRTWSKSKAAKRKEFQKGSV